MHSILITGASGGVGLKLRRHFARFGWTQHLLDRDPKGDHFVAPVDISQNSEIWDSHFQGIKTVIHLAANPSARADSLSVYQNNVLGTENVIRAALKHGVERIVFASSNWVMAGYRFSTERLTTDLAPKPINPYGLSKLAGERAGLTASWQGMSFIALRIGYNAPKDNFHGAHMDLGSWGQNMCKRLVMAL